MDKARVLAVAEIIELRGEPVEFIKIVHQEFEQTFWSQFDSAGKMLGITDEAAHYLASIPIVAINNELTANCTLHTRRRDYPTGNDRVSAMDWARVVRLFAQGDGSPKSAVRAWIDVFCHEREAERGFWQSVIDWVTGRKA